MARAGERRVLAQTRDRRATGNREREPGSPSKRPAVRIACLTNSSSATAHGEVDVECREKSTAMSRSLERVVSAYPKTLLRAPAGAAELSPGREPRGKRIPPAEPRQGRKKRRPRYSDRQLGGAGGKRWTDSPKLRPIVEVYAFIAVDQQGAGWLVWKVVDANGPVLSADPRLMGDVTLRRSGGLPRHRMTHLGMFVPVVGYGKRYLVHDDVARARPNGPKLSDRALAKVKRGTTENRLPRQCSVRWSAWLGRTTYGVGFG